MDMKKELIAAKKALWVRRRECVELREELRKTKLALDAAKYAMDVLERHAQELDKTNKFLKEELARMRDKLEIEQMKVRGAYPVDVDPIIAEKLREENKLLREELKVKEVWIVDLLERIREFRAETEELAEVTGTQRGQDAEGALKVIAEVARKFFEKYEVQA